MAESSYIVFTANQKDADKWDAQHASKDGSWLWLWRKYRITGILCLPLKKEKVRSYEEVTVGVSHFGG